MPQLTSDGLGYLARGARRWLYGAGLIVELAAQGLEVSFTPYEDAPTLLV